VLVVTAPAAPEIRAGGIHPVGGRGDQPPEPAAQKALFRLPDLDFGHIALRGEGHEDDDILRPPDAVTPESDGFDRDGHAVPFADGHRVVLSSRHYSRDCRRKEIAPGGDRKASGPTRP